MKKIMFFVLSGLLSGYVNAWEAKVVDILQHGDYVAVTLSPDPGKGNCEAGSPYLLVVDNTPAAQQRFSMILTALASGKKIRGYADECSTAIWGVPRPTMRRLGLTDKS